MTGEPGTSFTLSVSIVLCNSSLARLEATLASLARSVERARRDGVLDTARLTLVDNASTPRYRSALATLLAGPLHEALAPLGPQGHNEAQNRGFGAGHNRAQAGAREDLLLILNPDAELDETALGAGLAHLAAHPQTVALNPHSRRPDGSREYLCKRYPTVFDLFLRGVAGSGLRRRFAARLARYAYGDRDDGEGYAAELLSGACLLCRRASFEAVGGFDTDYFLYFEDFDLSRRLAARGELRFEPSMRIVHHGGDAAAKGWRHRLWFLASARRFFSRHGWRWLR
jgi:GT2 family glycosyltransferase